MLRKWSLDLPVRDRGGSRGGAAPSGNARWTGVLVRDLLAKAGLKTGARHLHSAGTDEPPIGKPPFLRSIELENALEDAIVGWEMNGEPILLSTAVLRG